MPHNVLALLKANNSHLSFRKSNDFYWSPKDKAVYYSADSLDTDEGIWALLHEVSHGLVGHTTYSNDFELLLYEVEAWEKAKHVATEYGVAIGNEHIERCLDTYRDWLYSRSTCTNCQVNSFQVSPQIYLCINCGDKWQVSASRFCRPYRKRHRMNTVSS